MPAIADATITTHLLGVLREILDGPAPEWGYFADAGAGAGLVGSIASLSPAQASRPLGPSGTSIAAHLHHLVFSLGVSAAWIAGDLAPVDWSESWRVTRVDADEWLALQLRLLGTAGALRSTIEAHALSSDEAFGGSIGALAHAVYHLAAIRQKAAEVRA